MCRISIQVKGSGSHQCIWQGNQKCTLSVSNKTFSPAAKKRRYIQRIPMLDDEAHSLLDVFLLGELAESQCYYEITRSALWKQWAAPSCFLSCVSLPLHLSLRRVVPEGGHPCPALAGHSVLPPPLARGDPSSPRVAPAGSRPAGGTLSGRAWHQRSAGRPPFPRLVLRMPLKCNLGIVNKSVDIKRASF